jgi:hypothetical protein
VEGLTSEVVGLTSEVGGLISEVRGLSPPSPLTLSPDYRWDPSCPADICRELFTLFVEACGSLRLNQQAYCIRSLIHTCSKQKETGSSNQKRDGELVVDTAELDPNCTCSYRRQPLFCGSAHGILLMAK